jgi:alkane 1-monooxygenase
MTLRRLCFQRVEAVAFVAIDYVRKHLRRNTLVQADTVARLTRALPFWLSLGLVPLAVIAAYFGGWTVLLLVLATWWLFGTLDFILGLNLENADPETPDANLFWYRLVTWVWPPLQFAMIFGSIAWISWTDRLSAWEAVGLMCSIGVVTGAVGIVYAHELMHQRSKAERWLGDILMAMALYSHFRSEHLLVHHRYVGTPRDTVTARYGENFHRFFLRVVPEGLISAWRAEVAMLARKGLPWWDRSNPFWRYAAVQGCMLVFAILIGGWAGLGLFVLQAFVGIWQLELINYIEHYGLTRKHLGDGKYEHAQPRHSWNTSHKASNWLLINLQRHSDHHYKPDRRYPLLQNYDETEAPQLPFGYPVMGVIAIIPSLWARKMNPRVRRWRAMYYPEITDWEDYNNAATPMPR